MSTEGSRYQRDIGLGGRDEHLGTDPPNAEKAAGGLPMSGKQYRDSATGPRSQFVSQEVADLGGPVGKRGRRQLDAFAVASS
jgi:hypothetical protein